jgi:hypothetical protein
LYTKYYLEDMDSYILELKLLSDKNLIFTADST